MRPMPQIKTRDGFPSRVFKFMQARDYIGAAATAGAADRISVPEVTTA
jgi:hypothetical protein